jgi:hypothetical protein
MKEKCKNCEKYLLSECVGMGDDAPDIHIESCYLENIYGLAGKSDLLNNMEQAYRKDAADWTEDECRIAYLREVAGLDVHMNGTNSKLFPLWNLFRSISVLHCLEIYQMLDVSLTLKDTRGESFYAGIPQVTPEDIRGAKRVLKTVNKF